MSEENVGCAEADGSAHELPRVRLGRDELVALDRLRAARGGVTRSELVRTLIAKAEPSPPPPPSLDQLLAAVSATTVQVAARTPASHPACGRAVPSPQCFSAG